MAYAEPMDIVFRLKFEAAIQDHVAKKATGKRAKAQARMLAADLRQRADDIANGGSAGDRHYALGPK